MSKYRDRFISFISSAVGGLPWFHAVDISSCEYLKIDGILLKVVDVIRTVATVEGYCYDVLLDNIAAGKSMRMLLSVDDLRKSKFTPSYSDSVRLELTGKCI